jgi:hypothetical protein
MVKPPIIFGFKAGFLVKLATFFDLTAFIIVIIAKFKCSFLEVRYYGFSIQFKEMVLFINTVQIMLTFSKEN